MECHDDIEEDMASATSRHAPVSEGECTSCHSPHKSALDTLLLAPSPDLCLGCHEDVKEKLETQRQHDPVAEDCLNCHQPHLASHSPLIDQTIQELCAECHDAEEDSFQESHIHIEAAVMNCVSCHAPHASKDKKFFKASMHSPFVKRNCDECHEVRQQ
jgi:predicted CXXCH cytochrome family protein